MEADIIAKGRGALHGDDDTVGHQTLEHRRQTTSPDAEPSGLICAGRQTMAYCRVRPSDADVIERFANAIRDDQEVALHVTPDAIEVSSEPVDPSRSPVRLVDGAEPFEYVEHAVNHKRVAIVGGGHCGLALSRTLSYLGYRVTLFDTRADVFTVEQNEWADDLVVVGDYRAAGPQVRFPELTHFVVMTSDYPSDVRALLGSISLPFPYKGVMGSEAKLKAIREDLLSEGIAESLIDGLYAPIGLAMTSNTPEEIAISVAAQILRERETLFPWSRPRPMHA